MTGNVLVVGNWKMNGTSGEAVALASGVRNALDGVDLWGVTVAVAPPFTALSFVRDALVASPIALAAQNLFWEDAGAFTGEISPPMLVDLGVRYVIVGHSERRQHFGETDDDVRRKTAAALAHGLVPIVAVGETREERDAGRTDERVVAQTRAALDGVPRERLDEIAIAYEPIWAIGSGTNCELDETARVMRAIRASIPGLDAVPLLYGGSVTPKNFEAYARLDECSGGLVGGASLDAQSFAAIARIAAGARG